MANKPAHQWKERGLSLTKWNGREPGTFQYSIQKTYKDKTTGEYKESKIIFENELPILKKLLAQAIGEIENAPEQGPAPIDDQW